MLLTIKLTSLRNSEFIQFFTDAVTISLKHNTEELGIKAQLGPLVEEIESIKAIHGQDRGSDISDELKDIDTRRDNCITGICMVLDGYTHHYDKAHKKAAEVLLNKIDSFGTSIARQNYPSETTSINGIIDSFNKEDKLKSALRMLNLSDWANKMDNENQFFNQRYIDRIDESAKQSDDRIKELRTTTTEKYRTLSNHIIAHATLKGEANYKPLIDQLNELTDEYNLLINRRAGTKVDEAEIQAEN